MKGLKIALYLSFLTLNVEGKELAQNHMRLFQQGEGLLAEGLYSDALHCYQQIWSDGIQQQGEWANKLILRQVACQLELREPKTALALLKQLKDPAALDTDCRYFKAVAHRLQGQYKQALEELRPFYLEKSSLSNEVALEKGLNLFLLDQLVKARPHLESVCWQPDKPHLYELAQLYLIRLLLSQRDQNAVQEHFLCLNQKLPNGHPLAYEKNYLEGQFFFLRGEHEKAALCFEKALPNSTSSYCNWRAPTLTYLIINYLKWANYPFLPQEKVLALFEKAESTLQRLMEQWPKDEHIHLLLEDLYLAKARRLKDPEAYEKAQQLLIQDLFKTEEERIPILLKWARAAPSYQERALLYQQLLQETQREDSLQAQEWYFSGLNDLEEALLRQKDPLLFSSSHALFEQASRSFAQAYQLVFSSSPTQAAAALKLQSLSDFHHGDESSKRQAWKLLLHLLDQPLLLQTFQEPEEIYALAGLVAAHLNPLDQDLAKQAETLLKKGIALASTTLWKERLLKALGKLYIQSQAWSQAEALFEHFLQDYPQSAESNEVLFLRAECAKNLGEEALRKHYLQQIYLQDPQSPYAPSAYFHLYAYREYMRGQRHAIKHLQVMPTFFPDHPFLINAHYLIGLDHMKDHLSEEGTILRRKNEIAAIDAFQLAESTFDQLIEKNAISPSDLPYFIQLRYRAMLERALANLAIAEASQGAKRKIYLEYAERVLKELLQTLHHPSFLIQTFLIQDEPYPKILEEGEFWLVQAYLKGYKREEADSLLAHQLLHYKEAGIQQGYLLSRVWYEKGLLTQQRLAYKEALEHFFEAEKAAETKTFLSPDQKLDLWIQQALCYKELKQWDEAMLLLSKVVNHEAISSLRIKAMYLRAELYALQGRPELALKQLDAASKKGGEWGKKAKIKLEQDYGY